MKRGGVGGANTKTGLAFELKTDLPTFIAKQNGYSIHNIDRNTTRSRKTGKKMTNTWIKSNVKLMTSLKSLIKKMKPTLVINVISVTSVHQQLVQSAVIPSSKQTFVNMV